MTGLATSLTSSSRRSSPTTAYDVGRPSTTSVRRSAPAAPPPPDASARYDAKLGTTAQCCTPDRSQSATRRRIDALDATNGSSRPASSGASDSA